MTPLQPKLSQNLIDSSTLIQESTESWLVNNKMKFVAVCPWKTGKYTHKAQWGGIVVCHVRQGLWPYKSNPPPVTYWQKTTPTADPDLPVSCLDKASQVMVLFLQSKMTHTHIILVHMAYFWYSYPPVRILRRKDQICFAEMEFFHRWYRKVAPISAWASSYDYLNL